MSDSEVPLTPEEKIALLNATILAENMNWTMTAGIIVFLMQAGFALLESGSVRFKNFQNILLKNCMDACLGGLIGGPPDTPSHTVM